MSRPMTAEIPEDDYGEVVVKRVIKRGQKRSPVKQPNKKFVPSSPKSNHQETGVQDINFNIEDDEPSSMVGSAFCNVGAFKFMEFEGLKNMFWFKNMPSMMQVPTDIHHREPFEEVDPFIESRYEMGKILGQGKFGIVKLSVERATGKQYAIKVMDKYLILKNNKMKQVEDEMATLNRLHHKNVVEVVNFIESESNIYIVMELVDGGDLYDKIVGEKRLSEETAVFYFNQLLDGIDYCHRLGVCHRDLKPENIMLDSNGVLKITDFGLSHWYPDKEARKVPLTVACGTPNYVAPEVLGATGYDGMIADIWSMGVILYAMLGGCLPFEDKSVPRLYAKIQAAEYAFPPWFKKGPRFLIAQILMTDPAQRLTLRDIRKNSWIRSFSVDMDEIYGGDLDDSGADWMQLAPTPQLQFADTIFTNPSAAQTEASLSSPIEEEEDEKSPTGKLSLWRRLINCVSRLTVACYCKSNSAARSESA